ncbi:hypothetical protein RFI_21463 [Reticulomyxa filosa]|uniref:Uncharacterized protein n=1 Tax=Reticulomyxa filosa TaxID=46433 RepID=X6MS58_RETFI|nr:hypothetical protein RFI_21463 [Reticulomyxa filosa]|eukprot:ETO15900.1 hypothetical protein RFI_21463 [Reticulomyxa filosa]
MLIPTYTNISCQYNRNGDNYWNSKNMEKCLSVVYDVACLGPQKLSEPWQQYNPVLLDDHFQWFIAHDLCACPRTIKGDKIFQPLVNVKEKICGAILISNSHGRICLFGTPYGLFYNKTKTDSDRSSPACILSGCVLHLWRQDDWILRFFLILFICNQSNFFSLLYFSVSSKLYQITITDDGKQNGSIEADISCTLITDWFGGVKSFRYPQTVIGCYYEPKEGTLYAGACNQNDATVYWFTSNRDKTTNGQLRTSISYDNTQNRPKFMYADVDRRRFVIIGTQFTETIPFLENVNQCQNKIFRTKDILPQVGYNCQLFLYSYHQACLVVLAKLGSSVKYPYEMLVFTNDSLNFN